MINELFFKKFAIFIALSYYVVTISRINVGTVSPLIMIVAVEVWSHSQFGYRI